MQMRQKSVGAKIAAQARRVAMLKKIETGPILILLSLAATPSIAEVAGEFARCQLEAERSFPTPSNKGAQNWADRAANLQKRAESVETCMRTAGYKATSECSAPLKIYESCMKIADDIMHGPKASQYRDADWNKICLDNEWDVRTQKRLSADCYQSSIWWRWLGR
jgi:hypothetical protein